MYKITVVNQSLQHLKDIQGEKTVTIARLINSPKGWYAHRSDGGIDPNPVQVSHLINQRDGADRIAEAITQK